MNGGLFGTKSVEPHADDRGLVFRAEAIAVDGRTAHCETADRATLLTWMGTRRAAGDTITRLTMEAIEEPGLSAMGLALEAGALRRRWDKRDVRRWFGR